MMEVTKKLNARIALFMCAVIGFICGINDIPLWGIFLGAFSIAITEFTANRLWVRNEDL